MSETYQEIKTAEQLQQNLHEKSVYVSVLKSRGNVDEVESFFTRMISLFRAGTIRARYFPSRNKGKVEISSLYPGKSVIDLFGNKRDTVGKRIIYYEHPDPTFEGMSIVTPGPFYEHRVFGKTTCRSTGRPVFDLGEEPESYLKYLFEQQKN